jgi:type VI secretion system protein ImpE
MNAKELLDAGRLSDAVAELNNALRARPTDSQLRVSLFEVLCFAGDYERAARQLDVLVTQTSEAAADLALHGYRSLLAGEKLRQQVFAGTALPKFVLTPPPSVEQYVVLLSKAKQGTTGLPEAYAEAEETTPEVGGRLGGKDGGRLGGKDFVHFRDADDRVAPVLEAFHGSDYLWLPFEQMRRLEIAPPKRLRELMWLPATVEMHGQPPGEVLIPALYANSHAHPNDHVKLGRLTEWDTIAEQIVIGVGQRVFLADGDEHPVLDLRSVEFAAPAAEGGTA